MNQEIDTFESICAGRGEPIEVFDIVSPPERDIRCGKFIPSPDPVRVGIWRLPDDIEGGLMVCGTYHTGAPFQWHYNCGERSAVAHLLADRDRLRSELDAARAELARVRAAASGVFAYLDARASFGSGNAPGHAHTRPGIWDDDNGAKSGTECEWCKLWGAFRAEIERGGAKANQGGAAT